MSHTAVTPTDLIQISSIEETIRRRVAEERLRLEHEADRL